MGWTVGRLVELSIVPDGTNQIWMDNLNCPTWTSGANAYRGTTTETHVEQCQHNDYSHWQWGDNNCTHAKDIGVGCDGQTSDSISGA